jgi:hypothetical protein
MVFAIFHTITTGLCASTGEIGMAGWQSQPHDSGQQRGDATPGQVPGQSWQQPQPNAQPQYGQPQYGQPKYGQPQYAEQQYGQPQYQQLQPYQPQQPALGAQGQYRTGLTGAQQFWYVLQCIAFGAGYFAKIPAKKALADFGMAELTSAEKFWYVLQCVAFGAGYFAKLPTAKALSEMPQLRAGGYR